MIPGGSPVLTRQAQRAMKKLSFKKFLVEFGRYFEPAAVFYHARIAQGLSRLGFQVLWIERLSHDSRWELRLRATVDAQAQLVGRTYRTRTLRYGKAKKLLESWLKTELRSILRQVGGGVKIGPIVVARHGANLQVSFVWSLGTPGKWRPTTCRHPFRSSGMVQAWLKDQRN